MASSSNNTQMDWEFDRNHNTKKKKEEEEKFILFLGLRIFPLMRKKHWGE
jgi:hypothetical protein